MGHLGIRVAPLLQKMSTRREASLRHRRRSMEKRGKSARVTLGIFARWWSRRRRRKRFQLVPKRRQELLEMMVEWMAKRNSEKHRWDQVELQSACLQDSLFR